MTQLCSINVEKSNWLHPEWLGVFSPVVSALSILTAVLTTVLTTLTRLLIGIALAIWPFNWDWDRDQLSLWLPVVSSLWIIDNVIETISNLLSKFSKLFSHFWKVDVFQTLLRNSVILALLVSHIEMCQKL